MNNDADDRRFEWKYGVKPGPLSHAIAAAVSFVVAALIMIAAIWSHRQ